MRRLTAPATVPTPSTAASAATAAQGQLLAVTESITDAVVCARDDHQIVFWNAGAERMFGWSAGEAIGRPLTDLMPERFRAAHRAGVRRILETGETRLIGRSALELVARHRDGHEFPIELSLGRFHDGGRELFTGVMRDLTERARQVRHRDVRAAVARALAEAQDEQDAARRLLEALGGGMGWSLGAVWLSAPETGRLHCIATWSAPGIDRRAFDEASLSLHPGPGEGLAGQTAAAGGPLWMADARSDPRHLRRAAVATAGLQGAVGLPMVSDEGVVGVVEFYTPGPAVADDDLADSMEALCSQLGLVFLRKRAERRAAESAAEARARAVELERSNHDLEQFASIASHDLSEPLRTVTGFLDLVQRRHGAELPEGAGELIELAQGGAQRMRELIDDLLAYSSAGRVALASDPVDLGQVAAAVATTLRGAADGRDDVVRVEGALPTVRGDRARLEQVLQNLVANGLKFRDLASPEVTLRAVPEVPGWWRVTVEDNGIGVPPAQAGRIFDMFTRLHRRDEYPGTGIGLALCQRIVERHGGRIWHEARPGGGARFHFILPAA